MVALTRLWRVLLLVALLPATGWCEQSPAVTLQVAPKDLSIAAGEHRQVLVIATVTGAPVRKLRLRARPEPGTHAAVGKIAKLPEDIRGDVSWPAYISKNQDGKTSSRVIFEALYESGDPKAPVPGVTEVALDLTVKQRPKNEELATATIQTSFDKLEERRPQDVYLVLSNLTDVPLQVTEITVSLPKFVTLLVDGKEVTPSQGLRTLYTSAGQAGPLTIAPRQDHLFPMALQIPDSTAVLTGKYLMLFDVKLRYSKDGYSTESTIIATKDFQAGVLGEQEFVGITSAPFLLLPGFLVVTILGVLLGRFWPKWTIELDYKKPEFYLLGVVFSMLILFLFYNPLSQLLYPLLWKHPAPHSDLLAAFSLEDIVNIWVIAAAIAVLPWMLIGGIVRLFGAARARIQREKTPTPQDEPLDVLLRLERAKKPFNLKQATLAGERLWELPLPSPDPAKKWVSGRISLTIPQDLAQGELQQPAEHLRNLLNQPEETAALNALLTGIRNRITIIWQPDRRPELVDKKDAPTVTGAQDDFVSEG